MKNVKRGDIYYIERNKSRGHEMRAGRPAVIVSNDALNCKLNTVEVVYLTTSPREHNEETHVIIKSATKPSTAICENIATIDTELLGNWQGMVTKSEMHEIETAMKYSIGIKAEVAKSTDIAELEDLIDNRKAESEKRYQAACKERDKYKQLAENYRTMLIEELSNKEV
jgi:mRNA interferase MazF